MVDGFLVLAEDQYAIGDVIDVGFAAGGGKFKLTGDSVKECRGRTGYHPQQCHYPG
ncbi:hypothetical protein NON20_06485 [Synechocystis sp. B12]|nr:hypothetical protein NON20_06485 [Synechocystis sp. B12]